MRKIRNRWTSCAVVLLVFLGACGGMQGGFAQSPYKVEASWKISGEGSWDYLTVDSATQRLYIAHQTKVDVIDLTTGKELGSVTGLMRCHGVVISPNGKSGFITDGGANAVIVFDLATFEQSDKIPTGTNPDGMVYEPVSGTLWVFNGGSKNATVIHLESRKVVATVAMPGKPEFPVADGSGTVFVNVEDKNSVLRIDAKTQKITATWPLQGCESPSGLAIDVAGKVIALPVSPEGSFMAVHCPVLLGNAARQESCSGQLVAEEIVLNVDT